jgi:phosphatidylglycerol:prolipoprotein diacylglycerol transferase
VRICFISYPRLAKPEYKKYFPMVVEVAPCGITIAHALGRIGCFFAGCCGGIKTDSFLGMYFPQHSYKVFPTQLFEAVFLLFLFAVLSYLFFKDYKINMIVYLLAYGIFRFMLEFIRGDERGEFIFSFLSPSQTISIFLIITALILLYKKFAPKLPEKKKDISK